MRLDQGKINTIIKAWQDHPFAKTAVIKAQVARYLPAGTVVGTGPITKYYPWERKVGETIRQNQARRALETYPSMKKCELIQLTGISNNTFDRTVGVVYPSDRRRASVQTPLAQSESIQADIEQRVLESSGDSPAPTEELVVERGSVYGHPLDDFRRNAAIEAIIAECKDPEIRHAIRMVWVKCCRLIETPDHYDSIEDIKGYAETMHMIHRERKVRGG